LAQAVAALVYLVPAELVRGLPLALLALTVVCSAARRRLGFQILD
jgi:hypothetical protein